MRSVCWNASLLLILFTPWVSRAQTIDVWVGSSRAGIYHLTLDTEKGTLSQPELVSPTKGAGFLALHPDGNVLYATSREKGGGVTAFSLDREVGEAATGTGVLTPLGTLSTGDGGAACIAVDQTGSVLMSAQYGGGSVTTYRLDGTGNLLQRVQTVEHGQGSGVHEKRQATAHPHWVGTSPDNRFLAVPDLGMDQVVVYELETESGEVKLHSRVDLPPGSGPRHMKFHPDGQYAFVLNELTLTLAVFQYEPATGRFEQSQLVETLPERLKDKHLNSAAEVRVHPSGRFIYTSNRGHDSISVFSFDRQTGKVKLVERESVRGAWPRNFNIDPSGKWLIAAGQHSNTLALFEIDQESGELIYARQLVNATAPICVLFEPE
ncbi:MAG: lactonase family protein [Mariniblastus sp.]|nr:lactonase family protein [Mariniblastus sp.]